MMRITILFGGTNKERLVSVASAQALHQALPEADLWFWDVDDTVHEVTLGRRCSATRGRSRMNSSRQAAASAARAGARQGQGRGPRAGARPARRQGGERRIAGDVRDARHPLHRLRLGVVASRLRQGRGQTLCRDRAAWRRRPASALEDIDAAFAEYGKLIAKPARDGSSYGLIFVNREAGPRRRPQRGQDRGISDRAVHLGRRKRPAACWSSRTAR